MKYTFGGHETTTYAEYLDVEKGRTLVAEPGGTYEITPATGHLHVLPMPPDGRWTPAKATKTKEQG